MDRPVALAPVCLHTLSGVADREVRGSSMWSSLWERTCKAHGMTVGSSRNRTARTACFCWPCLVPHELFADLDEPSQPSLVGTTPACARLFTTTGHSVGVPHGLNRLCTVTCQHDSATQSSDIVQHFDSPRRLRRLAGRLLCRRDAVMGVYLQRAGVLYRATSQPWRSTGSA
jgi:hypothetical protein